MVLKNHILVITIFLAMFFTPTVSAGELSPWTPKDASSLNFEVLRNGKKFGYHNVSFKWEGEELVVNNEIELKVTLGPLKLYSYEHKSVERWKDGVLTSMKGKTKKEGERLSMLAVKEGDQLSITGTGYEGMAPPSIIPSSHWNIREIQSSEILSSEDGKILPVDIKRIGEETLKFENGASLKTTRYRLISDLTADLWYDENGRWVKCQFSARGQNIEYILTTP